MDRFPRAHKLLKVHEGGYVNHPRDPGGATNKGVTQRTYDAWRRSQNKATQSVKNITDSEASKIYREEYWNPVRGSKLPDGVAYCVFDAAVNSGVSRASKWAQKIVGVAQDGNIGPMTLEAINAYDPKKFIHEYCDNRLAFMKRLPHWDAFKNGWSSRVQDVRAQSLIWAEAGSPEDVTVTGPTINEIAKALGPVKRRTSVADFIANPGVITSVGTLVGGLAALENVSGPIAYAISAALIIGVVSGVVMLFRKREKY